MPAGFHARERRVNRYDKLVAAIRKCDAPAVAKILDRGLDPNAAGSLGPPLCLAAYYGSAATVRVLIERGSSVRTRSGLDFTPLHYANCAESARLLIDAGADVASRNGVGSSGPWKSLGNLPLHTAVWHEAMDVVELLVSLGTDINSENADGDTVLHEAAACHSVEIVSKLLDLGANPEHANKRSIRPIQLAIECRRPDNALRLIDAKATLTPQDEAGLLNLLVEIKGRRPKGLRFSLPAGDAGD